MKTRSQVDSQCGFSFSVKQITCESGQSGESDSAGPRQGSKSSPNQSAVAGLLKVAGVALLKTRWHEVGKIRLYLQYGRAAGDL